MINIKIISDTICPWCYIGKKELEDGMNIIDLVIASNLSASKSEVRRILNNNLTIISLYILWM